MGPVMSDVRPVKAGWYNVFRPWTLHGAIVPVLIGGAVAYHDGKFVLPIFLLVLAGGLYLTLMRGQAAENGIENIRLGQMDRRFMIGAALSVFSVSKVPFDEYLIMVLFELLIALSFIRKLCCVFEEFDMIMQ